MVVVLCSELTGISMKELRFHGQSIVTGIGSLACLRSIPAKRVFVVTGGQSMFANGTIGKIESLLSEAGIVYRIHRGVSVNPGPGIVYDGIAAMREFGPDTVIGVGGGSALDAAKLMALFYAHPELDIEATYKNGLPQNRPGIGLICIPGTSGTASEVTPFAVLTFEDNFKMGGKSSALVPDKAILDAEITLSMPAHVAAETGVDALSHAIECFTNPGVEEFSSVLASGAIEGLFMHLEASVKNADLDSREKIHYFQCMAGCAFSNVGTGLDHGIAHSFGGRFNLGHGLLIAVALPHVIRFNSRNGWATERYAYLARRIGVEDLAKAVLALNRAIGIPDSFSKIGVPEDIFEHENQTLVENALKGSSRVNPRLASTEEMRLLLFEIFTGKTW
jgi:alcohol dehydrogenase class IV